ncbi:hypothetical protein BB559_001202 [Furculomyces boomerangus]|uniref:ORC6 second cyclin-like domain-containing protein n=2 Tax=Harpellales TaxID=61421 RepID=A0A2T9Z2R4_9FUNG|nr:hypothetical protein BB559_001202 [Furculomyces boomerangus]PVZ99351.1 hypothetical protein BB558_004639 [Smittium angustum]PWA01428.1 hypothetical protein BB558_002477 [Smittium angustum]
MNSVISDLVAKAQIDISTNAYAKALQFYTIIQNKFGGVGRSEVAILGGPISIELACESENIDFDRNVLIKLSAYPSKTYQLYLVNARKVLGLEKRITVNELCIKFGVPESISELVKELLFYFEQIIRRTNTSMEFSVVDEPAYMCASFQIICNGIKKQTVKVSDIVAMSGESSSSFQKIRKLIESKCTEKVGELVTRGKELFNPKKLEKKKSLAQTTNFYENNKEKLRESDIRNEETSPQNIGVNTMISYNDFRESKNYKQYQQWKTRILTL